MPHIVPDARPRSDDPAPATLRARDRDRRKRLGLVLVQIGPERYEVTEAGATRLRRAAEALVWAEKPRQP